jgi:ribosomal protein S18 acetylase RimI-like enzyme
MTDVLEISAITDQDIAGVIALWQRCGLVRPWNDPAADIALARVGDNADVLVGRAGGAIAASVLVGHDGHRGWVYYVAVDPDHQRRNFGGAIMQAAEDWLRARGIEKLQLMVRPDNTAVSAFYESQGFGEQKRVIYAKWLDGRPLTP